MRPIFLIGGLGLVILVTGLLGGCVGQIDQGEEGVKVSGGVITTASLEPGYYVTFPSQQVFEYSNRSQSKTSDVAATAATKDMQQVGVTYTYKFNLNKGNAGSVYNADRGDWEQRLVGDFVNEAVKNVVGQYDAVELVQKRSEISPKIREALQFMVNANGEKLGVKANAISINSFTINNIEFSPEFMAAIEQKVTAVQLFEKSQNETKTVQEQANQRVIAAKAEAESMAIRSQALSQNQSLVAYEAVQKWDGKLPTQMLGNSPLPFINIK